MDPSQPVSQTSSQRMLPSKQRLTPSCTVFPDYAPPPPSFPPHSPTPSNPTSTAASRHDYFSWLSQCPPDHDISTPAPSFPTSHLHPAHDRNIGAWYSFAHGLQSPLGTSVFSDQLNITKSMREETRRNRYPPGQSRLRSRDRENHIDPEQLEHDDNAEFDVDPSASNQASAQHFFTIAHNQNRYPASRLSCRSNSLDPANTDDRTFVDNAGEVTAEMVANGVDIQGIPWHTFHYSREDYRAKRLRDGARRDAQDFYAGPRELTKEPRRNAKFYNFFRNTRRVKCTIVHFQLRNLAWATSKHDVFVMHDGTLVHWDAARKEKTRVLDLCGGPTAVNGLGMVQISTMIAKDDLLIAGGFYGEMIAKNMRTGAIVHDKRITYDENAITNAIDIFDRTVMTSNNDCYVRCFDMETFTKKSSFGFQKPVNHATRQPGGKMVAVAEDDRPIQVIDGESGDRIAQLCGHDHYSFATGWHPDGRIFATGSQDQTCRVWDVRNMSQAFRVLGAHTGAVRSLRFSSCGRFLAMAEPRDFVHIFDVNRGEFDTCQEIDFFGEIAGISLSPSAEALYIAVSDSTYSSLLEYERKPSASIYEFDI
eukprot:GFKZ01002683.1.p1 GENE.GFKZ01002683.1~~GFKZ01002683.1.p1  ORF type:complete len:696 (-),score=59.31 GFKZ01002683.1:912-2690(-)